MSPDEKRKRWTYKSSPSRKKALERIPKLDRDEYRKLREAVKTAKKQVKRGGLGFAYDEKSLNETLVRADLRRKRQVPGQLPDSVLELANAYEFTTGIKEGWKREKYTKAIKRRIDRIKKDLTEGKELIRKKIGPHDALFRRYDTVLHRADLLEREIRYEEGGGGLYKRVVGVLGLAGLIIGLFFLSSNSTGFVISNLNQTSSNTIGVVLFLLGLIGIFICFKKRN